MSYSLIPYQVDLEQLRAAVGSKDQALINAVIARNPDSFGDEADEEADEEEEVSLREALRTLVMGEPMKAESAHQYGYALAELCDHLGEQVQERDLWESIRWEVLECTGADELMERTGSPVPLPKMDGGFPAIGHLTAEAISNTVAKLGSGHLTTAAPSGRKPGRSLKSKVLGMLMSRITQRGPMTAEDVRECLEEYEGWLRDAAAKKKSLVFFYY